VTAMCKKCLKSAKEEARRCASCGGRIVRFNESGEVIDADEEVEEKHASGSIPPLFADVDYIDIETAVIAQPQPTPGIPAPTMAVNLPPAPPIAAPAIASPAVPAMADPSHTIPSNPNPQIQSPPLLLPSSQIDEVVSEMLTPFGFERPAPATAPAPVPAPAPPVNVVPAVAQNLQPESNEEQQVRFFRSASPAPAPAPAVQAPAVPAASAVTGAAAQTQQPGQPVPDSAASMAELARDIFAIAEDDVPTEAAAGTSGSAGTDLIIGPAQKGGWLKRSKSSGAKGRTAASEGSEVQRPQGAQGEDDPMSELTATDSHTRTWLRSR
jgi:hypothetical protein